jgi:Transposase, Mutator family
MCRPGGGHSHRLPASAASTLLGAQDAEHSGKSAEARLRRSEGRSPGDLLGGKSDAGPSYFSRLPLALVPCLPGHGSAVAQDLPELLSFFAFPRHLWRKLRTTNVIERCFVEVRRRTRPMVCFVNVESVDRIIYSIFQRFNLEWKTRTLNLFTQAA